MNGYCHEYYQEQITKVDFETKIKKLCKAPNLEIPRQIIRQLSGQCSGTLSEIELDIISVLECTRRGQFYIIFPDWQPLFDYHYLVSDLFSYPYFTFNM